MIILLLIPICKISRKIWIRLWFLYLLFFLFFLTSDWPLPWDREARGFYSGINLSRVSTIKGTCSGDSVPLSGKGGMVFLTKSSFTDVWGNTASVRGRVGVIFPEYSRLFHGEKIVVMGGLSISETDFPFFIAKEYYKERGWSSTLLSGRARILKSLNEEFFPLFNDSGGFLQALLLGVRDDLDSRVYMEFQRAGVLHILALSGMHLGLITGLLSILLLPVVGRRWIFPVLSVFIVFYLWLAGFRVSLIRAALMFWVLGLGRIPGRKISLLRCLCISFFITLILTPSSLTRPGFQLSFSALLGIIMIGLPLGRRLSSLFPALIVYPLGVSVGAQITTLPVLLIHFNEWASGGILCSLILTPLITLFLWYGLFLLVLFLIFQISASKLFPLGLELLYNSIDKVVGFFAGFPIWRPAKAFAEIYGFIILLLLFAGGIGLLIRRGYGEYKLRFPPGTPEITGNSGTIDDKEVRAEFFN